MKESQETPAQEAKSHPKGFLKKAVALKSKKQSVPDDDEDEAPGMTAGDLMAAIKPKRKR
jgi:hypothetical protein